MKYFKLILLSPFIVFACLFLGQVAQAATVPYSVQANDTCTSIALKYNITCDQLMNLNYFLIGQKLNVPGVVTTQGPQTPPPPVSLPISPNGGNGLQIGFFQPPLGVASQWTQRYTDGAFPTGNNQEIFWEGAYTNSQVIAGQSDTILKSFATASKANSNNVVVLGEEQNCSNSTDPWIVGQHGNTTASSIQAIQHESSVLKSINPNIKISENWNADNCNGTYPTTSLYAGSSYVDIISVDGFSTQNETWSQIFSPALNALQGLGKPIWIGSEGSVSWQNQAKFVADSVAGAKQYGISTIIWFNFQSYVAPASVLNLL